MNDRYLFKAKSADTGEWVIGSYHHQTDYYGEKFDEHYIIVGSETNTEGYGEHYIIDPSTLCQCTSFKDKTGKLIFDNDIVKDDKGNFYKAFWQNKYYQFSWICIKSNFFPIGAKWDLWSFKSYEIEVISSIFDNPELLEAE